jgi:hypothetical protein
MRTSLYVISLFMFAANSHAHHGPNSQFDQSQSLEVTGVITKLRFVNPHSYVYFDVTKDDGSVENWRCEMRAATVLKRSGWSEDMFETGTRIHIEGAPARREPHGCYVERLQLDDGEFVERYEQLDGGESEVAVAERPTTLPNGQPNISGDWAAPQRILNTGETQRRAPGGFRGVDYAQSDAGRAAAADFDQQRDNPRYHCEPVNIISDWVFDQHINRIEQDDDSVTLTYGFMDIVRTVHLNLNEHPDNIVPSHSGHSIGHWEDNTLVVDTVGFLPGYLDGRFGIMHSDQWHVIERFALDHEQGMIIRDYVSVDPLYLIETYTSRDAIFLSATPFDPYNCEDLTTEIVEGH